MDYRLGIAMQVEDNIGIHCQQQLRLAQGVDFAAWLQALQGFVDHGWSASGSSGRKCKNQTKRAIAARIGVMLQPYGLSGDPNW